MALGHSFGASALGGSIFIGITSLSQSTRKRSSGKLVYHDERWNIPGDKNERILPAKIHSPRPEFGGRIAQAVALFCEAHEHRALPTHSSVIRGMKSVQRC